jgi:hypothetical protein
MRSYFSTRGGGKSVVGAVNRRCAGGWTNSFPFTAVSRDISLFECVQTGSGSHPATCSVSIEGKTIGGHWVDHLSSSNTPLNNKWGYPSADHAPSRRAKEHLITTGRSVSCTYDVVKRFLAEVKVHLPIAYIYVAYLLKNTSLISFFFFFFCGPAAQHGPWFPHCWGF